MKSNATPILDALKGKYLFIDNDLQTGIQRLGLFGILSQQGVAKRSGEKIPQLIFAVLVWPFLGADSISSFCGKMIGNFHAGGKDVIYRFLRREDINWRSICFSVSKAVCSRHTLESGADTAFVVDDTLKHRRGKKVEGVSSHFDHTECRHVLGHSPERILEIYALRWSIEVYFKEVKQGDGMDERAIRALHHALRLNSPCRHPLPAHLQPDARRRAA